MFERGTIILVPFPFTDLSGTKVRPALMVSHRLHGEDVVVVFGRDWNTLHLFKEEDQD